MSILMQWALVLAGDTHAFSIEECFRKFIRTQKLLSAIVPRPRANSFHSLSPSYVTRLFIHSLRLASNTLVTLVVRAQVVTLSCMYRVRGPQLRRNDITSLVYFIIIYAERSNRTAAVAAGIALFASLVPIHSNDSNLASVVSPRRNHRHTHAHTSHATVLFLYVVRFVFFFWFVVSLRFPLNLRAGTVLVVTNRF